MIIRVAALILLSAALSACSTVGGSRKPATVIQDRVVLCPPQRVKGKCPPCPKRITPHEQLGDRLERASECERNNAHCASWHVLRDAARDRCEALVKELNDKQSSRQQSTPKQSTVSVSGDATHDDFRLMVRKQIPF